MAHTTEQYAHFSTSRPTNFRYPTAFIERTLPLPYGISERSDKAIEELAAHRFVVHTGLTPDYAAAIGHIAQQNSIREYCPNDSTKRFATVESAETWLQKGDDTLRAYGRSVFLLLYKNSLHQTKLAGYGWTGPEASSHLPGSNVTFALRINESFQGMSAARPFTTLITAGSAALYGAHGIWLEAWGSNIRATNTYQRAGFVIHPEATEYSERPSIRYEGNVPDIRLYMSLPDELLEA